MFLQVYGSRDFVAVRDEALKMIHSAFNLLDQEFQNLDGCIFIYISHGLEFNLEYMLLFI